MQSSACLYADGYKRGLMQNVQLKGKKEKVMYTIANECHLQFYASCKNDNGVPFS